MDVPQVRASPGGISAKFRTSNGEEVEYRNVWSFNLKKEMRNVMEAALKYPYVAMDTEFPGIVLGCYDRKTNFFVYETLRENCNCLKLIQLGLTFFDKDGNAATEYPSWQFNFKFNVEEDMYQEESLRLLLSCGLNLKKNALYGIDPTLFCEQFTMSGLVLSDRISWLSFHSGYDFAYLLRILTDVPLPREKKSFDQILRIYFPNMYDMKCMVDKCMNLHGGLNRIAQELKLERVGPIHQSGSDSRLTGEAFFYLKNHYFNGTIDAQLANRLYGVDESKPFRKAVDCSNLPRAQTVMDTN